jgi:hypothetical protein
MRARRPNDISDSINTIAGQVNDVLNSKFREKYFESIIVLYSLLEGVLRWLIFLKLLWDRANKKFSEGETDSLREFVRNLNFYNCIRVAHSLFLIDYQLMNQIDSLRKERNDVVHQAWLYDHRTDYRVLRKKLERIARISSNLVGAVNKLVKKVGVDEAYEVYP